MTRKYSLEQIIEKAQEFNTQVLSEQYINNSTPIQFKCRCGTLFHRNLNNAHRMGYLCTICKSIERLISRMVELGCEYISHGEFVKNMAWHTYFTFKCKCGEVETKMISAIVKNPNCKKCTRVNMNASGCYKSGEESSNWQGGATVIARRDRSSKEYKIWRQKVLLRDSYICQCCNDNTPSLLQVHHIYGFSEYKELRFDVSNGITMCKKCHDITIKDSFHSIHGTISNTPEQLQAYFNERRESLNLNLVRIEDIIV